MDLIGAAVPGDDDSVLEKVQQKLLPEQWQQPVVVGGVGG